MISGLSSSGIASAIRTAGRARETMDTMARQIATGQRVASVKDDGAAWSRANALRSDAATWNWRAAEASRYQPVADLTSTHVEEGLRLQRDALVILRHAQNSAPGSEERRRHLGAWQDIQGRWGALKVIYDQITTDYGGTRSMGTPATEWHLRPWENGDTFLSGHMIPDAWWLSASGSNGPGVGLAGYSPNLRAIDLDFMGASTATFATAITEIQNAASGIARTEGQAAGVSSAYNGLWRAETIASVMADKATAAAGSLTEADLGKASAARAQAETRQQLALSTVRQAISTYANFASGLLGNAQRTQQGIMA